MQAILSGWTIKVEKIPKYVFFRRDFCEHIDKRLAILLVNDERIKPENRVIFQNMIDCIKDNKVVVKYSARRGSVGRRYPDMPMKPNGKFYSALIAMPRKVKNTIYAFHDWIDIDQKKGHPTILLCMAKRNKMELPAYEEYLREGRFDELVPELIEYYSADASNPLSKDDIKLLFNSTIYGGGHAGWVAGIEKGEISDPMLKITKTFAKKSMKNKENGQEHPFYKRFKENTDTVISTIFAHNKELEKQVCDGGKDPLTEEYRRRNRTMSYFCGIIENELTAIAFKFLQDEGIISAKNEASWGLDGLTFPRPSCDIDDLLRRCNEEVYKKCRGFDRVEFVHKKFDPSTVLTDLIEQRRAMPDEVAEQSLSKDGKHEYRVWKAEFEKEWCLITNLSVYLRVYDEIDVATGITNKNTLFKTKKDMITSYEHLQYTQYDENGEPTQVGCLAEWFKDKTKRCVEDINCYPPPLECPSGRLNMWQQSPFESMPFNNIENLEQNLDYDAKAVEFFLNHLKVVMANHDENVYLYLLGYFAHAFQRPAEKVHKCLWFCGDEGTGKSSVFVVMSKLLGHNRLFQTANPERDVWGQFNPIMASAYFIVLNEVDKQNAPKEVRGKIKTIVVDEDIDISKKKENAYTMKSYHRFCATTNSLDPVETSDSDRRHIVIRCSDEMKGNEEYFTEFRAKCYSVEGLRSIFWFLNTYDISDWNFNKAPMTEHQKTIIHNSMPVMRQFTEWLVINHGETTLKKPVYPQQLWNLNKTWAGELGYYSENNAGSMMKKLLLETKLPREVFAQQPRTRTGIPILIDVEKIMKLWNLSIPLDASDTPATATVPATEEIQTA